MSKCVTCSPFIKQCFVTVAVCSNLIGHGCVMGFPGILLPQLQQPDAAIQVSNEDSSWLASVTAINMLVGSLAISPVMGKLGRKVAYYSVSITGLAGWAIILLAGSYEILLLGRIVQGFSCGTMLPLRSILIGEYTSPKNRGGFLTTVSLSQGTGIFFVHLIGSYLTWQWTALVCIFFPFSSLMMTIYTPESPSWLADKGRYDECSKEFRWLRGTEEEAELSEMITARKAIADNRKEFNLINTLTDRAFFKPITVMVHLYAISQLCGAGIVATYSTTIISLVFGPNTNAKLWMIGLDFQRIVLNFLAIFIINKIRRRTLMFSSGALCVGSLMGIAMYVYLRDGEFVEGSTWVPGALTILQFVSISLGMVPLSSVMSGEIFPLQYRSIAGSISLMALNGLLFLSLKTFPALISGIGIDGTYVSYGCLLVYCLSVTWKLMPETKGKTLQEIEDEFTGRVPRQSVEEKKLFKDIKNNV